MRKTRQFRNRMKAVLDVGISAAIMGAIGHAYSSNLSGAVIGAGVGAAWRGMVLYPTLRDGVNKGDLKRVIDGPEEGLAEEVAQWKSPELEWAKAITMDLRVKPNWAERMKGSWIAAGYIFSWKIERERINWRWMNWMKQGQLIDYVNYFRHSRGQENPGIEVLRNSLLQASPETIGTLKKETVISEIPDQSVQDLISKKAIVYVQRR